MKIEQEVTFHYEGEKTPEDKLIPRNWNDEKAKLFIALCEEKQIYPETILQEVPVVGSITLALCTLNENETWSTVARELEKEGWQGASLSFWRIYIQKKCDIGSTTVILPGARYRDENFCEWVPFVSYHTRIMRKPATKISLKELCSIDIQKVRTLLVSKVELLKT